MACKIVLRVGDEERSLLTYYNRFFCVSLDDKVYRYSKLDSVYSPNHPFGKKLFSHFSVVPSYAPPPEGSIFRTAKEYFDWWHDLLDGYTPNLVTSQRGFSSVVADGLLHVSLESTDHDDFFYHWLLEGDMRKGELLIYSASEDDLPTHRIEFWDAYLVKLGEAASFYSASPMTMGLCISPAIVRHNKQLVFMRNWRVTDIYAKNTQQTGQETGEPAIKKIFWANSDDSEIKETNFGETVQLIVETENFKDGDELTIIVEPNHFTPKTAYDERKHRKHYTATVVNNKATLGNLPVKVHWAVKAEVKSDAYNLIKQSAALSVNLNYNGCGFQYLTYSSANPDMPISRTVEIDVYVVVNSNPKDYLNYKEGNGDIERLKDYLEWGFSQTHSKLKGFKKNPEAGQPKFRDEDGIPINFIFNMKKYSISTPINDKNDFHSQHELNIQKFRTTQEKNGKYQCKYYSSVIAFRVAEGVDSSGGTAGNYGSGGIILGIGSHNLSSERLDKAIVHEITHAFLGYNKNLHMGKSAAKHNNTALGGGGALAYGGSGQEKATKINIDKIIETLPYEKDRTVP